MLVLFVDASTIKLHSLIREKGVPFRLLLIGLPLTMALGLAVDCFHAEAVSIRAASGCDSGMVGPAAGRKSVQVRVDESDLPTVGRLVPGGFILCLR